MSVLTVKESLLSINLVILIDIRENSPLYACVTI